MSNTVRIPFCLLLAFSMLFSTGCQSKSSIGTGSLADYSNLFAQRPTMLVYMNSEVSNYNAFLIEPTHYRMDHGKKIRPKNLIPVIEKLNQIIHDDLQYAGYSVVKKTQPGIIRIRVILAQIGTNSKVYTQTDKLTSEGLKPNQAVLEAEILSLDGKTQLGAIVLADKDYPVTIKDLLDEKTADKIFKKWAKQLRLRIDEMHGRSTM